jgi:hypothetical protein
MVDVVRARAPAWIDELAQSSAWMNSLRSTTQGRAASLELVGDVIDLKLPWLLGHSRAVAELADAIGTTLGLPALTRRTLRRAGWLHGLGRVAVPNAVWNRAGPLSAADWERVRLRTSDKLDVEDARTRWPEEVAPFYKAATIRIPKQEFDSAEQLAFCENLSFTPWHALPEHKPLGSINRLRKIVYERISNTRHVLNNAERSEPQ